MSHIRKSNKLFKTCLSSLDNVRTAFWLNLLTWYRSGRWRRALANFAFNKVTSSSIFFCMSFSNLFRMSQREIWFHFGQTLQLLGVILGFRRTGGDTLISCLDKVTLISVVTSTTHSYTSSSLISSTSKSRMLSRRSYCSSESARNKLVISALFGGGDVLHASNPDVVQKQHKKGDP